MPLILPGNVGSATAATEIVSNSCRFNSGSSDRLHKSQSTGNQKTYTFSFWIKRSILSVQENIIGARYGAQGRYAFLRWNGDDPDKDKLEFHSGIYSTSSTSTSIAFKTNRVFRDTNAWYHIVVAVDSTQAAGSGNQFHIYVNGVEELSFTSATDPSENDNHFFNINTTTLEIGAQASDSYLNAYIAEFVLIDGQQLEPDQFGEFDSDSNIWKPIDVSGLTFGNNGFYLDFEDASNLGNDANGGTDLTEANITAIDQSTDTCINNFCTMNPLGSGAVTFSEGNLQVTKAGNGFLNAIAGIGASSGKWYAEAKAISIGSVTYGSYIGFVNLDISNKQNTADNFGEGADSAGISSGGGYIYYNGTQFTGSTTGTTNDDIVNLAMDLDNGRLYWGINGTYVNSGDPESGATGTGGMPIANITAGGTYTFAVSLRNGANYSWNFGSPNHTISSGNTDGNGFGNFEYAVPSGYFSLCTKNLAENG